jgi:hypothetical protein
MRSHGWALHYGWALHFDWKMHHGWKMHHDWARSHDWKMRLRFALGSYRVGRWPNPAQPT